MISLLGGAAAPRSRSAIRYADRVNVHEEGVTDAI